jgi:hypothetical protein
MFPLSQTVWKALHPGQNAMTSTGSAVAGFSFAPETLLSLTAVIAINLFTLYPS